jgi:PhnB protein
MRTWSRRTWPKGSAGGDNEEMAVKPVPDGLHTVTPYLRVNGARKLLDFVQQVFGAAIRERMERPDGSIMHAEVTIGDSTVMLADGDEKSTPFPAMLYIYLPDVDAVYQRAIAAGATSLRAPADEFYGDRNSGVRDQFGNEWWIGTHIEDVSPEEIERRMKSMRA